MKAVNLVPAESRRSTSLAGRSGGAAYVLVGGLAVLVLMAVAWSLMARSVDHKRTEAAALEQQATVLESQAATLKPYVDFHALRVKREQTVRSLAASRFDWPTALSNVSAALPGDVSLTGLRATVAPGVAVGGTSVALRANRATPALELAGCAPAQDRVAATMTALRGVTGVTEVALQSSQGADDAASGATADTSASGSATCSGDAFQLVVFLAAGATR
jgi:Tfp pilus assembly protein PilN